MGQVLGILLQYTSICNTNYTNELFLRVGGHLKNFDGPFLRFVNKKRRRDWDIQC